VSAATSQSSSHQSQVNRHEIVEELPVAWRSHFRVTQNMIFISLHELVLQLVATIDLLFVKYFRIFLYPVVKFCEIIIFCGELK
jgi:hypothetical protein